MENGALEPMMEVQLCLLELKHPCLVDNSLCLLSEAFFHLYFRLYLSVDKNANPEANNAPDSISFAELQEYAKTAKETMAELKEPKFDGLTQDQLCDLVDEMVSLGEEKCGHPMLAKLTIFHLLDKLLEWHTRAGDDLPKMGR